MAETLMDKKRHRILIVGVGSIGERHVRCFLATGRVVVGICELNAQLLDAVAERYDIKEAFATLETALDSSWDAVLIATPAHTHIPIALTVVKQGIPLLIEKPLSTSLDGVDELLALANEKNILTAVSYNYRAHPALAAMKAALDSKRFGAPKQLYALCGQHFATYRPAYADVYFADRAQGGGAIQDSLTHILNMGEWLLGPLTQVLADAGHQVLAGVDVEDTVHVIAHHGDVPASYTMNMYQQPNETILTVVCEKGTLRFEVHRCRWSWMDTVDGQWQEEDFAFKDRDDWYILNANAFLDALEGTCAPLCTLEEGIQTLRCNLAVLASADATPWQDV